MSPNTGRYVILKRKCQWDLFDIWKVYRTSIFLWKITELNLLFTHPFNSDLWLNIWYMLVSGSNLHNFMSKASILEYKSPSAPPQPKYPLLIPFITLYCLVNIAMTPPKRFKYGRTNLIQIKWLIFYIIHDIKSITFNNESIKFVQNNWLSIIKTYLWSLLLWCRREIAWLCTACSV